MKHTALIPTVALFALAGAAFTNAQYVLGVWLAFGTCVVAAYGLSATWFADRPATIEALETLAAALIAASNAQAAERADVAESLKALHGRIDHLTANLTSFTSARAPTARPPFPRQPGTR